MERELESGRTDHIPLSNLKNTIFTKPHNWLQSIPLKKVEKLNQNFFKKKKFRQFYVTS